MLPGATITPPCASKRANVYPVFFGLRGTDAIPESPACSRSPAPPWRRCPHGWRQTSRLKPARLWRKWISVRQMCAARLRLPTHQLRRSAHWRSASKRARRTRSVPARENRGSGLRLQHDQSKRKVLLFWIGLGLNARRQSQNTCRRFP